jgi:CRP-like cAMP-binding protein
VEHFLLEAYKGVREVRMDQLRSFVVPGHNRILSAVSRDLQIRLLPRMEKTSLSVRQILYEPDDLITHAWFPLSGVVSLLIGLKSGERVEVATVGNEGVAGIPLLLGADRGPLRAVCQVAGQALRMRADAFRRSLDEHPEFADIVRRYAQAMFDQVAQTTACNHVHSVQQRMCRWLLMTHDRVGASEFHLTQEFLAQMLGVRRPSVTVAAGQLQRRGLIRYQRGRIQIADRAGLESGACECYDSLRRELDRLLSVTGAG